jgi:starch phosphorylase
MKVLVNGGLNLSALDGWWAEAYTAGVGWALGDGLEHSDIAAWDAAEAAQLYQVLEEEVVPCFYRRDARGLPREWIARVRESMARLTARFSSNRMLREYTEGFYIPLATGYRQRAANGAQLAGALEQWHDVLARRWSGLRFGNASAEQVENDYRFRAEVYLNDIPPDSIRVELYADPLGGGGPARWPMVQATRLAGVDNGYAYLGTVPAGRPLSDYTPRIVPAHTAATLPLDADLILWYH